MLTTPLLSPRRRAFSPEQLEALTRLQQRCAESQLSADAEVVKTGWEAVDQRLPGGGLARGAAHEWIGTLAADGQSDPADGGLREARGIGRCARLWRPPLGLMIHLAQLAHLQRMLGSSAPAPLEEVRLRGHANGRFRWNGIRLDMEHEPNGDAEMVWIGQAVWPYPIALTGQNAAPAEQEAALSRCLFIRAESTAARVSAAALVLRSRAVSAVIVDGTGFDLTATRRLSLTTEMGAGFCLLVRPPHEQDCLSAARTRWLVRAAPGQAAREPGWIVELLRCKGLQPTGSGALGRWNLERHHATRAVVMAADVGDRPGLAANSSPEQRAG